VLLVKGRDILFTGIRPPHNAGIGRSTITISRGVRVLHRLLGEETFDLRGLDLVSFRRWLDHHLARWQNDPVFVQSARIRDIRRAHPRFRVLEREHRLAIAADANSQHFVRLGQIERELLGTAKAISGLTAALQRASAEKRQRLRKKPHGFQVSQRELLEEQATLIDASQERQTVLRAVADLQSLRTEIGLDQEEARLARLQKQRGRRSGRSGTSFEQLAVTWTRLYILPELLRAAAAASRSVRVLTGVTLGAARTEFDQMVIQMPKDDQPVDVLTVVEVKRNINDLAHGFRQRQENLTWLTGDTGKYDPRMYRTNRFRSGHFDGEALHREGDEVFRFARCSFRRFRSERASGLFLSRFYFITRPGILWGVTSAALARISSRIATDERWNPNSDSYLRNLLYWCQSLAEPMETPDVLRLFASTPRRGRQILIAKQ
jgi:hypothetical protein